MLQNIIDNLKNQDIEPDLAQSNLIEELNNTSPKNNTFINKIKKNKPSLKVFIYGGMLEGVKQ